MQITDFIYFSDFFAAFMREKRAEGSHISYRYLSKALGLRSTSSLAMIAIGKRQPNEELLAKLCLKLGLDAEQLEYARHMQAYEKAKKADEKQFFWEKMNRLRPTHNEEVDLSRLELISQWEYLLLICLAGEKKGIPTDLEFLSRALRFRISASDLQDRLAHLEKLGFLSRENQNEYRATQKVLATPKEANSNLIKNLHQQMLKIASEEVYQQRTEDRYFTFAFMTASPKKIKRAKDLLNDFRNEFDRSMAEEDEDEPTEVYQLGLQFFKMTHFIPEGK